MLTLLSLFLIAPVTAGVDQVIDNLRTIDWEASLDRTAYPPSPYTAPSELPSVIAIETSYQAFNDYYYFAIVDGRIWYKPRFKRPTGQADWDSPLPWKVFGLNGGLPYRLSNMSPQDKDTTYADGGRKGFVEERLFETLGPESQDSFVPPEDWSRAGSWPHSEEMVLDADFPQVQRIVAITADDDEIAALGDNRQMFYRRRVANIFINTEWYWGWGQSKDEPVFFPEHISGHKGWSLGRITAFGAGYKEGPDGRIFEWGPAAVSMETMVWLSPDGHVIYYLDSGTQPEVSHYVQAPFRGQWKGETIDSSASTIMVMDRFGAIQTKIADFDLLGSTPTHPYCHEEECDDEPFYAAGDIRSGMSDIRLPSEGWTLHDPLLPAEAWGDDNWLTTRITIVQTGKGNVARELRVVGSQEGELGYFHKPITGDVWGFRPAPAGDKAFDDAHTDRLDPADQARYSGVDQAALLHADEPPTDVPMSGKLKLDRGQVVDFRIADVNPRATPWNLTIMVEGVELPVQLDVVQAWSRFRSPHPAFEDQEVHTYEGTLMFDRAEIERTLGTAAASRLGRHVRRFLDKAKNNTFELIVNTTAHGVEIRDKRRRKIGPVHGIALSEDTPPPVSERFDDYEAAFWAQQEHQMGWREPSRRALLDRPEELGTCDAQEVGWAARVLMLNDDVREGARAVRRIKRQARRYAEFTFVTSGFLYMSQMKTMDAMLDTTREWRSAEVRPNELRFNVVNGVTSRIPYLSGNIRRVHKKRQLAVDAEKRATLAKIAPLVRDAEDVRERCP